MYLHSPHDIAWVRYITYDGEMESERYTGSDCTHTVRFNLPFPLISIFVFLSARRLSLGRSQPQTTGTWKKLSDTTTKPCAPNHNIYHISFRGNGNRTSCSMRCEKGPSFGWKTNKLLSTNSLHRVSALRGRNRFIPMEGRLSFFDDLEMIIRRIRMM